MMPYRDFPALRHLLQGYLNEDWPEEYGQPWKAIEDFIQGEPDFSAALGDEIWHAILSCSEESELESLVIRDLGSGYFPPADGWTFQSWLIDVARRVRAATQTAPER